MVGMPRFLIPAILVVAALTLYCLFELLLTPKHQVRSMPKAVWFLAVLLLPVVGPLLWLFLGRARQVGTGGPAPRMAAPDDDEEFLRSLRVQRRQDQRDADLDRRATELDERERRLREQRGEGGTGTAGTDGRPGTDRTDGDADEDGPEGSGTDSPSGR